MTEGRGNRKPQTGSGQAQLGEMKDEADGAARKDAALAR